MNKRGRVYISNATIDGKFALRACITNHRTTSSDLDVLIDEVLDAASIRLRGEHRRSEAL